MASGFVVMKGGIEPLFVILSLGFLNLSQYGIVEGVL